MLHHGSFIFQIDRVYEYINVMPGHRFLSILPVWHSFERAVEYIVFQCRGNPRSIPKLLVAGLIPDMGEGLKPPVGLGSVPQGFGKGVKG